MRITAQHPQRSSWLLSSWPPATSTPANVLPLRPPPPMNAVAARSKSSPQTVRRRQALEKPQDSAPQTRHGALRTPNAHRPSPAGAGEETEQQLPTPHGEARNPAQRSTLAGKGANELEANPNNRDKILPHFARAEKEPDLQSPSPSTPP